MGYKVQSPGAGAQAGRDFVGRDQAGVSPEKRDTVSGGSKLTVAWCLVLGFMVTLLAGCGTPAPVSPNGTSLPSAIIIVPGYYGTKLAQVSDGDEVWLDAWEALFGRRSLRVPLPGLGFGGPLGLRPAGILKQITVIPWLYSVDGYGLLGEALRKHAGSARVVPLSYDWRLDPMDAVRQLGGIVDDLRNQGHDRIAIVAHSLGGLITGYYLRYGTQDPFSAVENWNGAANLSAVILAGVPFRGSMTQFRNMEYGVKIGLNRALLEQNAVASFPAGYHLLPAASADVLLTPTYEPMIGMIRKPAAWKDYGWGLLKESEPLPPTIIEGRFTYTVQWLRQAGRFSDLLLAPPRVSNFNPVPLLSLVAKGHPTLATGVLLRNAEGWHVLFNREHFEHYLPSADPERVRQDGDGSVTMESSALPAAYRLSFRTTAREYQLGHEELVSDSGVLDVILKFLAQPRNEARNDHD